MGMIVVNAMTKVRERGGLWLLYGEDAYPTAFPIGPMTATSYNPTTNYIGWNKKYRTPDYSGYICKIAYGGGYYLAGLSKISGGLSPVLYYTTNPVSGIWTAMSSPLDSGVVYDIDYSGTHWVVSGYTYDPSTSTYTKRLITATSITGPWTENISMQNKSNYLAYGNGYWVTTDYSLSTTNSYYAVDPTGTWTTKTTASTKIMNLAFYDNYFVFVGYTGLVGYTTDPSTAWTTTALATSATLNNLKYGNGYWVIIGTSNTLAYAATPAGPWTINDLTPYGISAGGSLRFIEYGKDGYWVISDGSGKPYYLTLGYCVDIPTGSWSIIKLADESIFDPPRGMMNLFGILNN